MRLDALFPLLRCFTIYFADSAPADSLTQMSVVHSRRHFRVATAIMRVRMGWRDRRRCTTETRFTGSSPGGMAALQRTNHSAAIHGGSRTGSSWQGPRHSPVLDFAASIHSRREPMGLLSLSVCPVFTAWPLDSGGLRWWCRCHRPGVVGGLGRTGSVRWGGRV